MSQFKLEITKSDFMAGLKNLPLNETFTLKSASLGEPWEVNSKKVEKFDFLLTNGETIGVAHATFRKCTVGTDKTVVPIHGLEVRIPEAVQFQVVEGPQKVIDNKIVIPRFLHFLTEVSAFS